jgi:hypothetical protein
LAHVGIELAYRACADPYSVADGDEVASLVSQSPVDNDRGMPDQKARCDGREDGLASAWGSATRINPVSPLSSFRSVSSELFQCASIARACQFEKQTAASKERYCCRAFIFVIL